MGDGKLRVQGELHENEYLTYDAEKGTQVFDRNWNFLRTLKSSTENWTAPQGQVDVWIGNSAPGPQPWLELQMITRGTPFEIHQPDPSRPVIVDSPRK